MNSAVSCAGYLGTEAGTDLFENPLKWAFFDASPVPKHRFLMYRNGNS